MLLLTRWAYWSVHGFVCAEFWPSEWEGHGESLLYSFPWDHWAKHRQTMSYPTDNFAVYAFFGRNSLWRYFYVSSGTTLLYRSLNKMIHCSSPIAIRPPCGCQICISLMRFQPATIMYCKEMASLSSSQMAQCMSVWGKNELSGTLQVPALLITPSLASRVIKSTLSVPWVPLPITHWVKSSAIIPRTPLIPYYRSCRKPSNA